MFIVQPGFGEVMGGFVPQLPHDSTNEMIGLIGAVIMPHNLFLHSALVQSRSVDRRDKVEVKEANKYFSIEASISLFISLIINISVIATFAFYHLKDEARSISLENADQALQESFGNGAKIVWGIGLMAAGQSSTMTGTYAGQFVMQGFVNLKVPVYIRVLITRSIAIVPALIVAFVGDNDSFAGFLNILQAIQLPFALIPLLKFTASDKVMGGFQNSMITNIFCVLVSLVLIALNMYGLIPSTSNGWIITLVVVLTLIYLGIMFLVIISPVGHLKPLDSEIEEDLKAFAEAEDDDNIPQDSSSKRTLAEEKLNLINKSQTLTDSLMESQM
jgi:natural resistance-associated macrophage protein